MLIKHLAVLFVVTFCAFSPVQAGLINCWSFNNASAPVPSGSAFTDTVSGNLATVRGNGATLGGTALVLQGTTNGKFSDANISAYDLSKGIISTKTNLAIEIWATPLTAKTQQRLFDFGNTTGSDGLGAAGEWIGATAPGATSSSNDLTLGMQNGAVLTNPPYVESSLNGGTKYQVISSFTSTAGTSYYYVITFSDGVGTNANIAYDEVRLFDHALTLAEISSSFAAKPDSVTLHPGQKVRIPVLANDSVSPSMSLVTVVVAPA